MIREEPTGSFVPEICGIRDDYHSGSKQPHSKGSAVTIYAYYSLT
jgi:hypothetical protein